MQRTLFYLPHEIGGVPLFGVGWMLGIWLVVTVVMLFVSVRHRGWDKEAWGQIPFAILVALAIVFVIPRIEGPMVDPAIVIPPVAVDFGLPIRGYGVMVLVGVLAAVMLACRRAVQAGLGADTMLNVSFVIVVSGIIGARIFFVIQYWPTLQGETWRATLGNLISIDKGGLVVYGSLIGAAIGFVWFAWRQRLPVLPLADLVAPSLTFGLAIGRFGCLLNGCCYGGECGYPWAVTFPTGSPPYVDQQGWGEFYGFRLAATPDGGGVIIAAVDSDGPFSGMPSGVHLVGINGRQSQTLPVARYLLEAAGTDVRLQLGDGTTCTGRVSNLPARSRPVHPTQIYSSINAALLCCVALAFHPFRRRHGQVFVLSLTLYAVTRFVIELIRSDEGDFFATLTISQNVSVLMIMGVIALWIYIQRQPSLDSEQAGIG